MGFPHTPGNGDARVGGVTFPHINQCCILLSVYIVFSPVSSATASAVNPLLQRRGAGRT